MIAGQWARLEAEAAAAALGGALDWPKDALFKRDFALAEAGQVSSNGSCRLFAASDGWIALNLAREDDRAALPALVEGDASDLAACFVAHSAAHWRARGMLLDLPLAVVGEAMARLPTLLYARSAPVRPLRGTRVLDLSTLWAGPLCAGLLAAAGAQVTRLHHRARPDPSASAYSGGIARHLRRTGASGHARVFTASGCNRHRAFTGATSRRRTAPATPWPDELLGL